MSEVAETLRTERHRPAPAVRAAKRRRRRRVAEVVDRRDGQRQPSDDGQRDPLPLRQPELPRSSTASRATRSLEALPERPDVVIVALNPLRAAPVTEAAAAAGVPAVIIPGGGVVEGGAAAAAMQADVARIAREHRLALVGPNCMGVIDLTTNSATYIGDVSPYLPRGGVAGIAQSGSVTDTFVHSGDRIGFSRIISCGSEVVLDVCDYLAYCLDDPETTSVILFLEGFKRPERFLALADRALAMGKPIMAVKVGRSDQAQAAAIAHTVRWPARRGSPTRRSMPPASSAVAISMSCSRRLRWSRASAGRAVASVGDERRGDRIDGRGVAHRRHGAADRRRSAADPGWCPCRDPGCPAFDGIPRQPARPVGRGPAGVGISRLLRSDGGVRGVRRARPRPRLPVPVVAGRGPNGERRGSPAAGRHEGPSVRPAGLRVADLGRATTRDEGGAR